MEGGGGGGGGGGVDDKELFFSSYRGDTRSVNIDSGRVLSIYISTRGEKEPKRGASASRDRRPRSIEERLRARCIIFSPLCICIPSSLGIYRDGGFAQAIGCTRLRFFFGGA